MLHNIKTTSLFLLSVIKFNPFGVPIDHKKDVFKNFTDADAVGSDSLWQEVEFIQLYDAVFTDLKLEGVTIKINNRKILAAIAERIGAQDKLIDFTVALDKLDKIGAEKVKEEMLLKGIPSEGIQTLEPLFNMVGNFDSRQHALALFLYDHNFF